MVFRVRSMLLPCAIAGAIATAYGTLGVGCSQSSSLGSAEKPTTVVQAATACDYSVLTAHNDASRSGNQRCETLLNPLTAPHLAFQFSIDSGDGSQVTAQPLYVHNQNINGTVQDAVIVATNGTASTNALVLVFNPVTQQNIISLTLAVPPCQTNAIPHTVCNGVLSTPVIDPTTNILYLVDGDNTTGVPQFNLLAYNLQTMTRVASAVIGVAPTNTCVNSTTAETFNPHDTSNVIQQMQRPALLLDHGHIYIAFGSANRENASATYNGWIFAYGALQSGAGEGGATLTSLGNPYCVSRSAPANANGRGGIWQLGAGPSADSAGNIYVATGNGQIGTGAQPAPDTTKDDGQSFVQIAGATWTGALKNKQFIAADYNSFLAPNEIEGSTGPIVLPGPSGAQRVLGSSKMGLFVSMNPATMATVQSFRAGIDQYGPSLGDPGVLQLGEVSCQQANACNARGLPVFDAGGTEVCCPSGCTGSAVCQNLIHGSHPHLHGQPSYLDNGAGTGGTVFWWAEKDFPRSMPWTAAGGRARWLRSRTTRATWPPGTSKSAIRRRSETRALTKWAECPEG